jgi:hypothetical protein
MPDMTDEELREFAGFIQAQSRSVNDLLQDKKRFAGLKRDVKRAERRVGDKAKWLLEFAYRDLSKLDKVAVNDLCLEVLAVTLSEYRPPKEFSTGIFEPLRYLFQFFTTAGFWSVQKNGLVDFFQSELRKRFDDCKHGRWWEYKYPGKVERFTVFRVRSPEGAIYADHSGQGASLHDILLAIATDILKRERERFGICQNQRCGKAFVSERKRRAKYCTPKCAAYVRVMKKRGKL